MDTQVLEMGFHEELTDFAGTPCFHSGDWAWGKDGAFKKQGIRLLLLSYRVT